MTNWDEIIGGKFSKLTVLARGRNGYAFCVCECGEFKKVKSNNIKTGKAKSCGCSRNVRPKKERTEREVGSRRPAGIQPKREAIEYYVWQSMNAKCSNPLKNSYKNYGGRGIRVCDRWRNSFDCFVADMGPRPSLDYTLERRDNDGDYEPDNCRWATKLEQANNTRRNLFIEHQGVTQTLMQWVRQLNLSYGKFKYDYFVRGLNVDQIIAKYGSKKTLQLNN